jgi:AcrR family transcriptional regulator
MPASPGRPRRASQELLQEAAFELFQLRGYRSTSVEQIAKTAGFSRATFFNFFSSKAELFWLETDGLILLLREFMELKLGEDGPPPLREALLQYSCTMTSAQIPWALQNFRLIEAADDLIASGAGRAIDLNRMFEGYLRRREGEGDRLATRGEAATITALLLTALLDWIDAGVNRGEFRAHLERALS